MLLFFAVSCGSLHTSCVVFDVSRDVVYDSRTSLLRLGTVKQHRNSKFKLIWCVYACIPCGLLVRPSFHEFMHVQYLFMHTGSLDSCLKWRSRVPAATQPCKSHIGL